MFRSLLLTLSLAVPAAAVGQVALAQGTLAEGTLSVGSDLTYPPYNYFADGNVPAGFDVEMMTEIARIMGVSPQFLDTRFENLILGVNGGQFDVIASTLYVNPDRARQIDYIPYMRTGVSIAVAEGSGLVFADPAGLCGHVVGSIKGAAWLAELAKLNEGICKDAPIDSRVFPTSPQVTQALMSGGIDAQIEDSAVLASAARMLGGKVKVTTTENFYPVVVGLGVKKGNAALAAALRSALADMEASGFYPALLARYGVSRPTEAEFNAAIGE